MPCSRTFKAEDPITSGHLFAMKQGASKILTSYVKRFVHVKCQASGPNEETILKACWSSATKEELHHGSLWSKLSCSRPQSMLELMRKLEKYAQAEDDELREAQERRPGRLSTPTGRRGRLTPGILGWKSLTKWNARSDAKVIPEAPS